MRTSRLVVVGALFSGFAWMLAGGCSSNDGDSDPGGSSGSGGGSLTDAQGDTTKLMPDATGKGGDASGNLHPLCGEGACVPDDARSCLSYEPPDDAPGAGGAGQAGAGGDGGMSSAAAGQAGAFADAAGGDGGATSGGASGGEAGNGGDPPLAAARYSCQVEQQGDELLRECEVAGTGKVNAPCFSASDCGAGLACVTEGDAGRCLRYCCAADSECEQGNYCAERRLRKATSDSSSTTPPSVPVCVPADDCSLEDVFPCPQGTDCRCKGDTACVVVRSDGTTTCLEPGAGEQGDPCPCAWNHVCSSATRECVKICRTDPAKNDCGAQKCQAASELPPNFGVCVGPLQ